MKTPKNIGGYERIGIGANIRKWRGIKGIKQKDLASALRLSEASISNMENDMTNLTLSQIEDLAIALEIEVGQLFSDPGEVLAAELPSREPADGDRHVLMDRELVYALIGSIHQKDEQLRHRLEQVMHCIDSLSGQALRLHASPRPN